MKKFLINLFWFISMQYLLVIDVFCLFFLYALKISLNCLKFKNHLIILQCLIYVKFVVIIYYI